MSIVVDKAVASYSFYVDWDNDGDFSEPFENITADVRDAKWSSGFDGPPPNHANAGTCELLLANGDSKYSTYYTGSPLWNNESGVNASYVRPGLKVQIVMSTEESSGADIVMWTGLLEMIMPEVGEVVEGSTATLTAYGMLSRFVDGGGAIDTQTNILIGDAVRMILEDEGFIDSAEDNIEIDLGQSKLARWWVDVDTSRLSALQELQDEELGKIREGKDGKIIFEDRHHNSDNHATARSTYGTGVLTMWDLRQENPMDGIYNSYKGQVSSFNQTDDMPLSTITDVRGGNGGAPIYLGPGVSKTVYVKVSEDAGYLSVATWSMVDYEANSSPTGSGTDITTAVSATKTAVGQELKIVFKNNGGTGAYVILLRAHGTAIVEGESVSIESFDQDSKDVYHQRDYPYTAKWFTDFTDAQAFANFVVASFKDPRPSVTFTIMANANSDHLREAQIIDVGDKIHITAGAAFGLYIDDDFIVDKMSHHVEIGVIHTVEVTATVAPLAELGTLDASYIPYNAVIVLPNMPTSSISLVPDDLVIYKYPMGLDLTIGARAWKYNETISAAELKYKYVDPGENPSYVDLSGETAIPLVANWSGANYMIPLDSGQTGRLYFAIRFMNDYGWSVWTDGNAEPTRVTDYLEAEDSTLADSGPPADWTLTVEAGAAANTVVVRATRPATNGRRILFFHVQIKDGSTGEWRDLDANVGAASTLYDGSAIDHTVGADTVRITRNTGSGFGTATAESLLLFDRRQGAFDVNHTEPFWAASFEANDPVTATYFDLQQPLHLPVDVDYRIKFVTPPWAWNTEGYLGDIAGMGWSGVGYWQNVNADGSNGDMSTQEFVSPPINIGDTPIANIRARVFFQNAYSWSDGGIYTTVAPLTPNVATLDTSDSDFTLDGRESIGRMLRIYFNSDDFLPNIINATDGQKILMCLINTSSNEITITLDDKYRNGKAFPTVAGDSLATVDGLDILDSSGEDLICVLPANSQGYLEVIYDAIQDKFDVQYFNYDYINAASAVVWAYWKLDEISGNRLDSTENGHSLIPEEDAVGIEYDSALVAGNSLKLTAQPTGQPYARISNGDYPDLSAQHPFTAAFWFKVSSPNSVNFLYLDCGGIHVYVIDSGESPPIIVRGMSGTLFTETPVYTTRDVKHCVMFCFDGSTGYLYLDNVLVDSDVNPSDTTPSYPESQIIEFGDVTYQDGIGWMDEVCISLECWTETQRDYFWNGGVGRSLY